jgi:hypothetical protein
MGDWHQRFIVDPVMAAFAAVPVGGELHEGDLERMLAIAVEGLFRTEVAFQYKAWPQESTTDGSSIHLCWRSDERVLTAIGLTSFDFTGDRFPFRAEFAALPGTGVEVAVFIGEVVEGSGRPSRLPGNAVIVAVRDEDDDEVVVSAELIAGRRQVPIGWTKAIEWRTTSP